MRPWCARASAHKTSSASSSASSARTAAPSFERDRMSGAPRKAAALAIDLGSKRCGFAVSDALRLATTALATLENGGDTGLLLEHVAKLLDERDVSHIVLGLPLDPQGNEDRASARARALGARLSRRFPALSIAYID